MICFSILLSGFVTPFSSLFWLLGPQAREAPRTLFKTFADFGLKGPNGPCQPIGQNSAFLQLSICFSRLCLHRCCRTRSQRQFDPPPPQHHPPPTDLHPLLSSTPPPNTLQGVDFRSVLASVKNYKSDRKATEDRRLVTFARRPLSPLKKPNRLFEPSLWQNMRL